MKTTTRPATGLRIWQWLKRPPHLYVVLLIIIGILTHLQWFNPFSVLQYADWQYRPDEHVRQLLSGWNTWIAFDGLGKVNILMSGFPFRGIAWSVITQLGFTYDIATKLTLFMPIAVGGFLLPFLLGRRLFKDDFVAFVTALFYGSTTYFLIIQTAHLPIAIIYMMVPLLIWQLDRAMDNNRWRDWTWLSLLFCVGIFYEVRMMYIVGILLALYFAYFAFTRAVHIKYYVKNILSSAAIVIGLNLFWLLPTKFAAAESIGEVAGRGLFGDALFNLLQSLTLMRWNWTTGMPDSTFTAQPIPAYLWVIPLIIGVSLVVAGKLRKRMVFFLAVTVIGLLLSKQSAEPFASLYHWLYMNFPGFMLFREASKFYILVAIGYFGLLGYGLLALRTHRQKLGKWRPALGFGAAAIAIVLVAVVNLSPAFTTQIGGVFKNSTMPEDYKVLKKFLASQPEYFRTYWVPRESWWGFYDNAHPKVRSVDVIEKEWRALIPTLGTGHGYDLARANLDIFRQPYSDQLFDNAAIKYVIVPIRDRGSQEDFFAYYGDDRDYFTGALDAVPFLKRVNIGTKDLAVYENTKYRPYISAIDSVYAIEGGKVIADKLAVASQFTGNTTILDDPTSFDTNRAGNGRLTPLFSADAPSLINGGKLTQRQTVPAGSQLYTNPAARYLSYDIRGATFRLWEGLTGELKVNGKHVAGSRDETMVSQAQLTKTNEYYLSVGARAIPIEIKDGIRELGNVSSQVQVFTASRQNLIPNPSFEKGQWQQQVKDCNNYNDKAIIGMQLNRDIATDGKQSLQLAATKHTACTNMQQVPVSGGDHLFAFDYQNEGGQKSSYSLQFNDATRTTIKEELATGDEAEWHHVARAIQVPKGATEMTLEISGYPDHDHHYNSLTRYDNFRLSGTQQLIKIGPTTLPDAATTAAITLPAGEAEFTYEDATYDLKNLIPHASFEDELWQKEVADCNDYDDNPDIGMTTSTQAVNGRKSLQLEAGSHIACTTPGKIKVAENQTYVLSFGYQSDDAASASYYVQFDDPSHTTMRQSLPFTNNQWQRLSREMTVPAGATHLSLTVYATPNSYSNKKIAVRYDNFLLARVPSVLGAYFAHTPPSSKVTLPQNIAYQNVSPTKKVAHITGAKGPFYLTLSEGYHKGWRAELQNSNSTGPIDQWSPLARPDAVASSQHLNLNTFQNAWYVDPAVVCDAHEGCTKNADGSYDFHMIIEFAPQRWFVAGTLASVIVLIGVSAWLAIAHIRTTHRRSNRE